MAFMRVILSQGQGDTLMKGHIKAALIVHSKKGLQHTVDINTKPV